MIQRKIIIVSMVTFLLGVIASPVFADTDRKVSTVLVKRISTEDVDSTKYIIIINLKDQLKNPKKEIVYIGTDSGSDSRFWFKKDNSWVSVSSLSKEAGDKIYYISKNIIEAEIDGNIELGLSTKEPERVNVFVSLKGERELRQFLSGTVTETYAEILPVTYNAESEILNDFQYDQLTIKIENQLFTYSENKVYINLLNNLGEVSPLGEEIKNIKLSGKLLSYSPGSNVNLEMSPTWEEDLRKSGITYFTIKTDKPGEIEMEAIANLEYNNLFSPDIRLITCSSFEVFPKKFGANEIVLYLHQKTALVDKQTQELLIAPFIQDGRSFVPVRFLGEALGAEVKWNPDTQTIVLSRPDKMITMTIGNSALLLSTGEVVMSDVPPQIKDGFTVLPLRAVSEVFGAQVSTGYNNTGEIDRIFFYNIYR